MGEGEERYGEATFTPYQPDPTPEGEPPRSGPPDTEPPPTFVPYGGEPLVPYGGASISTFVVTPATPARFRWVSWLVGFGVLLLSCGGGCAALVGGIVGSSEVTSGPDPLGANDLQEGQCVNGAGLDPSDDNPVAGLEVVACSTAHDGEVLAVNVLDAEEAAAYDFDDDSQIDANCRAFFSEREEEILLSEDYFLWALTETSDPVTGDKVACIVVDAQGDPLRGPVDMTAAGPGA